MFEIHCAHLSAPAQIHIESWQKGPPWPCAFHCCIAAPPFPLHEHNGTQPHRLVFSPSTTKEQYFLKE